MIKHFTHLLYRKFFLALNIIFLFKCVFMLSQYDTTHYIPYFGDLTGRPNKLTNLEYEPTSGGAYIMFSTFESGPVNVKVYRRKSDGTAWATQSIYNQNIYPGQPRTWHLDRDRTALFFRYSTHSSLYNSGWLQSDDYGLKIVASKNIYVRVVLQPDARKQGYIAGVGITYGNGTATHGAAFTSKGVTRGAGVDFYTAHFYVQNKPQKVNDTDFISVMSLEDGNSITLDSSVDWDTPNGNTTVSLDEGESALFRRSWSSNSHSLGTRIYSTNNKQMVVSSGSWGGRLKDNEGSAHDLGIEQLVPVEALGNKYLMSKTKSRNNSNNYRVGIVVTAVEEGTTTYTFNGSSNTLSKGGVRFHRIPNFNNNGTGNVSGGPYAVISDKKLLTTYQAFGNAQSAKDNQFGMTILGPLYDTYTSPGYNKVSLGNGYYEHALWKAEENETLTLFYMTSATNAELNSLATGKVKFQGTSLNPTTNFYTAGSQTIDGETWQIRYREIDDAARNNVEATSNSESFFDFSTIDKPVYVWWQAGFDKQGNVTAISPFQVGGCEVPTITQQPSIVPNNVNEGTNSQLRVTTSPSTGVSYTWQISPDGTSWGNLSGGAVSGTTFSSPTSPTVNLTGLSLDLDDYQFRVIVENATDPSCVVTSTAVTLNVICTNPTISDQPSDLTVAPGSTASFTVTGTHANGVTYNWEVSSNGGSSYFDTGVTSSTINFSDLGIGTPGLGNNGWTFKVSVYNSKDNTCYVESNVATLYVVATNDCPVYNPITLSSTLKEDLDDIVLNLNSYVTDANADTVSFTNISSNNTTLVAATLSGTASLVLSFQENQSGSAQISFDYTDGNSGCDNTATFNVNIQAVNDCPTINAPLNDVTAVWNSNDQTISLSTLFNDVDTTNLTYTVTNTDSSIISTTISGANLIIDFLENQYGTVTVTVGVDQIGGDASFTASDIATSADGAHSVFAADMDGDGDMDIISASYLDDTIAWYENNNGDASSWTATDIATNADGAASVFAADLDGDGDMDIVSASILDDTFAWYENNNGDASSWTATDIATNADGAVSVFAADMDGDGDMDIVSASYLDDTIAWYENNNGDASSWTVTDIATSANAPWTVFAADMDGDGDMDIVSASHDDDTIAWYENNNGDASSWTATDIATSADGAYSVFAADMDGDGDMDIVSASRYDDAIAWYENNNGDASSWTATDIATSADGAYSVFAADMDGDGDMDILSASYLDDTIAWYENNNGDASSWTATDIAISADNARSVFAADMDGDGDMDILSASWDDDTIAWYENSAACTVSDTFVVTVIKPNQEPSFTKGPNITVCENSGAYIATGWATDIDDGDGGTQNVSFDIISNSNPGIFDIQPQISATGTLTFTLKANRSGNVTLLARILDDGGTANGGDYQSDPQTFYIIVNAEDNPNFIFSVSGSTITEICENDSRSIDLIVSGTSNQGTFTVSPSGIMSFTYVTPSSYNFTVNSTGTATITFTTSGTCPGTVTKTLTLTAAEDPSFTYSTATFCAGESDPSATITTSGGTFSSSAGLVFTDTSSGTIDLSASTAGSYTVTYTTQGLCSSATSTIITIQDDDTTFSYDSPSYSQACPNPTPTITGVTGGTFSSGASLTINTTTGEIITSTSSPGTYTVSYTITGTCTNSSSFQLTITSALSADFSYVSSPYCDFSTNVIPNITGQSGGTFTVPSGVSLVDNSTGEIDISASTPGSYIVSYTIVECGSSITATTTLEITASVTATVAYGAATYSDNDADPTPTITGHVTGTFTASPTGLSFTSTSTGQIDLSASTLATYEITFTPSATCSIPVTTTLKIQGCPYVENPIGYPLTIPSSQIAFYEFEGNGDNSESPGSYDLTLTAGSTYENQQSQGVSSTFKGQSSLFKTSSQYAYVHLNDAFSGASGLTISTWVKIKEIHPGFINNYNYVDLIWINNGTAVANTDTQPRIRTFFALKNDNSKTLSINGKATGGDFSANNDENQLSLTTIDTDKKWHHCAFSIDFDNQNARLFIDGELYANSKFTGNYKSVDFLLVGDLSNQNNELMYDELRVFDTALTDKEIRNIAHTSQHQRSTTATPQTDPTFDLSNVFTDPNSNDTLTYTASVTYESENGLATVSISSSMLTVDINDATEGGNAVIEVTASDGTCSSTHTFNLIVLPDKDQDGIADEDDLDDDNDGILDTVEGTDTDGDGIPDDDADGDGVPNHLDTDSDNDGCLDSEEAGYFLGTSSIVVDAQGRRINDNEGPITIGTDAYTASNTLLDINGNSVRDYLEDGPTIALSYAESYYCTSGTDPTPTLNFTVSSVISGTISPTGAFTSSPTGLVFSNSSSGTIDLSASASNTYIITFNSTAGGCPSTVTTTLQIIGQDDATFSYDSPTYCVNDTNPTPTITLAGGTFSSAASLTLNTATGEITTSTSSPGTYTVTYTTAGTCSNTSSVQVIIYALDDASFSYPRLSYCISDTDPIPTLTASQTLIGGTFTSGSGLTFTSSSTGIIDLSASTPGTYTVTFTTNGNCPQSFSRVVTINNLDDASFSYAKAAFCINESDPSAIITGTILGEFTSSSGLVFTNTYSGTIDLDASIPGTYTVTYTTLEIIKDGLVLYLDTENPNSYPGSGNTWYDLSGNDNDLTLYGNPLFDAEMNGGVIDFDEINNYAETNSTSVLNRTSYTKIAIFYPRTSTRNIISGNGGGVSTHAFWMNNTLNSIRSGHNGNWSSVIYTPGNMRNSWNYSAVTFSDTDGFELFYNGTSVDSNTTATTIPAGNGLIRIGAYGGGGGGTNFFDGYIPVVLVYDRALNAEEIALNYNYFAQRYGLTRLGDIGGFCPNSSSFEITINPLDNADFSYDSSTYCVGGTDPTPTITGLLGGTFSSSASLSLNTASGTIDLSASSPGSYTVTYTTAGNCSNTSSFNITIVAQDNGTFSYGSLLYCKGDANPTPTISEFTGGSFVSTAGLSFVSTSTGEIDLSASVSGTYTVSYTTGGTCTVTTSQIIQIADKDDASFSYPRTSYTLNCNNPTPTITGLSGGVWEAPAGLTINPSTGEINLSASASGTYTVSYTVENLCRNTATTTVILSPADDPYFSYSKYSYCVNESDPTPLAVTTASGTFSGSASITVDATTGAIDISASSVGNHVITYTTSSTCPSTSSRSITITSLEDASFTFSSSSYCKGSSNVSPTISTPGGTFTSPAGLYMNTSTGLINIALSTPGTYTVTYTTAGTCTNTSTGTITINALDDASFSYADSNYCSSDSDPSATITGLTGGTFSSSAGLVFTDTNSGTIDLDGSTPGTYTVTYTTSGTCTNTAGFEITITGQDSATIAYGSATYCPLETNPTPTIVGFATGTFSSTTGLIINTATGEIDISASASGTYTISYTTQGTCPITVTTTVQIIECPDTDGDGVPDITENSDGTNPNDLCDYVVNSQDASKTSNAWKNADCDGDGVTNNQEIIDETDPNDVCSYEPASQNIANVTAAWNTADCDGDGITNEDENNDSTDVFDSCDGVNASVTLPITTTTDCDGDGSIADDPDNLSPGGACTWGTQNLSSTTPFWQGLDCDGDGVTNGNEVNDGTDPQNACDYTYSSISLTVSATNDCDGDGVGNDQEALDGTDPEDVCSYISSSVSLSLVTGTWNSADCDGDGVTNGQEVTDGTDWANVCSFTFANQTVSPSTDWNAADCDGDGVTNGQEITDGTLPTDGCSYTAANITLNQSAAWRDLDCDQDGVTNGQELTDGTNPQDTCSYNSVNQVIVNVGATWNAADCDGDSVTNGQEVIDGTSPTDTCSYSTSNFNVASTTATWQNGDCDQDGVPNGQENTDGTDPKATCDYIVNNQVLANVGPTWNAEDCDGDGVTNGQEIIDNTGTNSSCDFVTENITMAVSSSLDCDGDSVSNAQELIDGTDPKASCDYLISNFNVASVTAAWDALDCDGDGVINGTEKGTTDYHDDCSFTTASITVSVTSQSDCDGDGVTNAQEDIDNTDPKDECSFVDNSISLAPTTPKDCDGDGVLDSDEEIDGTDANDICDFVFSSQSTATIALWSTLDCDGDGVTNGDEITDGTNPKEVCSYLSTSVSSTLVSNTWNLADCDGDGVTNQDESNNFTNPLDPCDYLTSLQTVSTSNAWNNLDCDGDGVTNQDEITDLTNPLFSCSVNFQSITVSVTSNLDCDADGVSNANEFIDNTDPLDPCSFNSTSIDRIATAITDCDGDGVNDQTEINNGTDPNNACSFNISDITMAITSDSDCDGDGVPNSIEIEEDGTNPNNSCDFNTANVIFNVASGGWKNGDCDGDGVTNGQEILDGTDPKNLCSNIVSNQTLSPSNQWNESDCNNDGFCNACPIITSSPTIINDLDEDGIPDEIDDDDDGDGVPDDQDEFPTDGTEWEDLDRDGVGDNKDVDDDNDGINDVIESPNGDDDFDGDGIPNYLDTDSDNDGCPDVLEAGYVDPDGDLILGLNDGIQFNEIGQVIYESGYDYPADSDNNGILDFLEKGSQVEIVVNPVPSTAILPGRNSIIQAEATSLGTINYQWQVNKSAPTSKRIQWENIDNGEDYTGTKSNKLIIRKPTSDMAGWRYRVIAFSPCFVCGDVVESEPSELFFTALSIPKAFSPNGDGFNDTWEIKGLENYIRTKLTIYNRWEIKVYEKTNYQNDWDGSSYIGGFGGSNTLPDGVYFYILELDDQKPITGYIYLKSQ